MARETQQDFDYLLDQSHLYRQRAKSLPAQLSHETWWTSLLLQVGDTPFICRQSGVHEVIALPRYAALPSANDWVLGVANLRGELLPLIDLSAFFGVSAAANRMRRVLICQHRGQWLGLVVDAVFGMHRMQDDQLDTETACPMAACQPFVTQSAMVRRRRHWLLMLEELLDAPSFTDVGRPLNTPTVRVKQG